MRSRWLITIWPAIHFYSKLTISLLTILSETWPVGNHGYGRLTQFIWNDFAKCRTGPRSIPTVSSIPLEWGG